MRCLFLLLLSTIVKLSVFSQAKDTIFFDKNWRPTLNDSSHVYYRVYDASNETSPFKVKDYYASGQVQMEGAYLYKDFYKLTGVVIWYFENGKKMYERNYVEGMQDGICREWYANGTTYFKGEFKRALLVGKHEYWYSNGRPKQVFVYNAQRNADSCYTWWENGQQRGIGTLSDQPGHFIKYDHYWTPEGKQMVRNGKGKLKIDFNDRSFNGPIRNGLKTGRWNMRNEKGKKIGQLKYKNGDFQSGYLNENGYKDVFTLLSRMPYYREGGEIGMNKYISENIRNTCSDQIENTVFVRFVVDTDGSVTETKLIKGEVSDCQQKAIIRLMQEMPKWAPGIQDGQYIKVPLTIPIKFTP